MDISESSRSRSKRDIDERTEVRDSSRMKDEEDCDGSDKRKHRSSRSRKHSSQDEVDEQDIGRRKSYGDRDEIRKKSGTSSRAGSGDEEAYDLRRESRSKIPRKSLDDRSERRTSESYRDRDLERHDSNSLRMSSTNPSGGHDVYQGKTGSKFESSHGIDVEKGRDNESRYSERKESNREKDHGREEQEKDYRRVETSRRAEESNHGERKASDHYKHGSNREQAGDLRIASADAAIRVMDSSNAKGSGMEGIRVEGERNCGQSDAQGEDSTAVATPRKARDDKQRRVRESSEDLEASAHRYNGKSYGEKAEKHRQDEVGNSEMSVIADEGGLGRARDRSGREFRHVKRSRSPERSGRYHRDFDDHDRGFSESDTERAACVKGKEKEKENYRDDMYSKGRDNWESSKDNWRRSHSRQDAIDRDNYEFDHAKGSQRREKERIVADRLYGLSGYRKENRTHPEGLKTPQNSGSVHDNLDSIEIRPNQNFDFGRESVSTFPGRRPEAGSQLDVGSGAPNEEEWGFPQEERFQDDASVHNSPAGRGRGLTGAMNLNRTGSGQSFNGSMHPPQNNQGSNSFNRAHQQGQKGIIPSRGRGRPLGRDSQHPGLPLPMLGSPFGPINLPPGPVQLVGPNFPPSPAPPIPSNVFLPPFPGPLLWPGARGVDMNMLSVPPSMSPIPPGPGGPRFGPANIGNGPNHPMYFNQQSSGRGAPCNLPGPMFNQGGPIGHDVSNDRPPGSWSQTRNSGQSGKAPSRGEQNDYSQNFVDTGMRPQNFIRELELTSVVEDYPKLRELIQRKDEIVANSASPPMYYKCDLKEHVLSPEFFGTKFDVILVDPPWEEYVHRAPGVTDHLEHWSFEEIQNLKIEAIADTPSFIFLWVGDGVGLEQGRQCLKKWGFRRCEDICWVKTNKKNATPGLRHDSHTLFQHSKEHCLMGIKGTVRRSTDGHVIHANIDTDIIIAEEPPDGSTKKPDDMHRIIEHFSLGKRRLELFGNDHNIRPGWLTLGKGLSSSNFNAEAYVRNFADQDGKVWQGGAGRNPPPEAPHLVLTTPEIEGLRPKSPPAKSQQQQQSMPLITIGNSICQRASENSSQNPNSMSFSGINPDGYPDPSAPPMVLGPESGGQDDKFYGAYGFNPIFAQVVGDRIEIDPHRTLNMNMM